MQLLGSFMLAHSQIPAWIEHSVVHCNLQRVMCTLFY